MDNLEFQSSISKITENIRFCKVLYNFFNGSALSIGIVEFDDISSCTTFLNKSKFECVPMPLDIYNALKACEYYREGVIYEDVVKLICKLFSIPYHSNKLKSGPSADLSDEFLMEIEFEKVQGEMIKNGDFAIAAKLFPWFNISLLSLAGNYKRTFVQSVDPDIHKNPVLVSVDNSPTRAEDKRNDVKSPSKHSGRDDSSAKRRKRDDEFSHRKSKEESSSLKRKRDTEESTSKRKANASDRRRQPEGDPNDGHKTGMGGRPEGAMSKMDDHYDPRTAPKGVSKLSKNDERKKANPTTHSEDKKRDSKKTTSTKKDDGKKRSRKDVESRSRHSESSKHKDDDKKVEEKPVEKKVDGKQITIKNSLDEPKKLLHPDLAKDLDSIRESKVKRLKLERKLKRASEKISKRSRRLLLDNPSNCSSKNECSKCERRSLDQMVTTPQGGWEYSDCLGNLCTLE